MKDKDNILPGIGKIYVNGLKRIGSFLAFVFGSLFCGALLILPLWYLAEHATQIFTYISLALIAGGVLFLLLRRGFMRKKVRQGNRERSFLRFLWNAGVIILLLAVAYFTVLFVLRGRFGLFILLLLIFIAVLGVYVYARNKFRK